jgi:hypothetical protein
MRNLLLSVASILALFFAAHARAQVAIPDAVTAGTGCPAGTAIVGVTTDGSKLVALFDDYTVNLQRSSEATKGRKNCTLAIPVDVPKNMQLVVKEIAVQNDVNLSKGSKSTLNAEVFFAGSRGVKVVDASKGPMNRVRNIKKAIKVVSKCGEDAILRVNTALLVEAEAGRAALSGVRDKLELKLAWQRCR